MFVSSHCFSLTPSDESKWQPLLSSFAVNKWPECGVRTSATDARTDEAVFIKSAPRVGQCVPRGVLLLLLLPAKEGRQEGESKSHFSLFSLPGGWMVLVATGNNHSSTPSPSRGL